VIATEYGTGYPSIGYPSQGIPFAAHLATWLPGPMPTETWPGLMTGPYPRGLFGYGYGPVTPPGGVMSAWPTWGQASAVPAQSLDDESIRELVYDTIDAAPMILPDVDVEIDVNAGVVTLKGRVPGKRTKHAVGEAAWWIPGVVDVNNQLQVSPRRERRPRRAEQARGAA